MASVLPRFLQLGGGSVAGLGPLLGRLGIARPLIVTDPFLATCGIVERVRGHLGVDATVYDGTIADPTSASVDALAATMREVGADGVVAVGGGSVMDSAKAAILLAERGGAMRDYKAPAQTNEPLATKLVCVPTTSGTGSEATRFTIVTDDGGEKMLCVGDAFVPDAAVCDYELTMGCPKTLTADTGVDALCHAMEAYVSRKRNPLADGFALDALKTIGADLRGACADEAAGREGMMRASLYAGIAFSASSVTLVHGMSRPLGARFKIAHGRSNAVLAAGVTAYSLAGAADRYGDVCAALNFPTADLPGELAELARDLGVPSLAECLAEKGVDAAAFDAQVPVMAAEALASGSPANNPTVPSAADVEALYRSIYASG